MTPKPVESRPTTANSLGTPVQKMHSEMADIRTTAEAISVSAFSTPTLRKGL